MAKNQQEKTNEYRQHCPKDHNGIGCRRLGVTLGFAFGFGPFGVIGLDAICTAEFGAI